MAQLEQMDAPPTPAADSSSHLLNGLWSKAKSAASTVGDTAQKVGHTIAEKAPGYIQKGKDEASSLATEQNKAIAERAGKAGAQAFLVGGPHAAIAAAGISAYEQKTGHKVPLNPLNIKGEIAKHVINSATGHATGSDAPASVLPRKIADNIENPFVRSQMHHEQPTDKPATSIFKGIKDTASKYLPHPTIVDQPDATQTKR